MSNYGKVLTKIQSLHPNLKILGEYTGMYNSLLVENEYGVCSVTPQSLYKSAPTITCAVDKTLYWINRMKVVYGTRFDYSKSEYITANDITIVTCMEHGDFYRTPSNHLQHGCPKCNRLKVRPYRTKDSFLKLVKKIHPDLEIVSEYKGSKNKILVKTQYGVCSVYPSNLRRGKPDIMSALNKTEYWINSVKHIHNCKYDYSKSNYISARDKVLLICPNHGEFYQTAASHQQGFGCERCAREGYHGLGRYSPTRAERHKEEWLTVPANVYYLTLSSNKEVFNKVGITTTTIEDRFKNLKEYELKTNELISTDLYNAINLEKDILNYVKRFKYVPLNKFGGHTECFNVNIDLKRFQKRRNLLSIYESKNTNYKEKLIKYELEVADAKAWIHKLEAEIQEYKEAMTEKVEIIKDYQAKIFGAQEAIVALNEITE